MKHEIRDRNQALYRFTARQFRHTVGMRLLNDDVPIEVVSRLFGHSSLAYDYYRKARLMAVVDAINAIYGRDSLFFAVQGSARPWKMRQSRLSGRFTKQWSEILTI